MQPNDLSWLEDDVLNETVEQLIAGRIIPPLFETLDLRQRALISCYAEQVQNSRCEAEREKERREICEAEIEQLTSMLRLRFHIPPDDVTVTFFDLPQWTEKSVAVGRYEGLYFTWVGGRHGLLVGKGLDSLVPCANLSTLGKLLKQWEEVQGG